jgi:hypothetical protein
MVFNSVFFFISPAVFAAWLAFRSKTFEQFSVMAKGLWSAPLRSGTVPSSLALIVLGIFVLHVLQRRFDLLDRAERSPITCAAMIAGCKKFPPTQFGVGGLVSQ